MKKRSAHLISWTSGQLSSSSSFAPSAILLFPKFQKGLEQQNLLAQSREEAH
jgi:hypothetical protein